MFSSEKQNFCFDTISMCTDRYTYVVFVFRFNVMVTVKASQLNLNVLGMALDYMMKNKVDELNG